MNRKVLLIDDLCTDDQNGKDFISGIQKMVTSEIKIGAHIFQSGCDLKLEIQKAIDKAINGEFFIDENGKTTKIKYEAVLLDVNFGEGEKETPLGISFALPRLVNENVPIVLYSNKFKDTDYFKLVSEDTQKLGKVCVISPENIPCLNQYLEVLINTPENFASVNYGFNYRFEDDVNLRDKVQNAFNKSAAAVGSKKIEVPLIAPIKNFLGSAGEIRPLTSKESNKLFATIANDGAPLSVRYEGTALVARWVAHELREGKGPNFFYHYFQEMVRVEFAHELDESHFRSFFQAGLELFSIKKNQHIKNIDNTIKFIHRLTQNLNCSGLDVKIRVSHVNVLKKPLEKSKGLEKKDFIKRRIIGLMEKGSLADLQKTLDAIDEIESKLKQFLVEIKKLQAKEISVSEGIKFLKKWEMHDEEELLELYEIEEIGNNWKNCTFDPGIYRSLNFYSGITIQGDFVREGKELAKEVFGGGGFTGMVESFGYHSKSIANEKVYSFGLAIGVERLLNIMK